MRKQFWTILISMLILSAAVSQAQWRITTTQGNIYHGVILNQDNDIINLRTLDNTDITLKRAIVESMVKVQTRIETKSGEQYIGFVSDINDRTINLVLEDVGATEISRTEVVNIEIVDTRETLSRIKSDETYSAFGITLLAPGGANLSYSHSSENAGIRISAGTLGVVVGGQVNLLFNINRTKNFNNNISIGLGSAAFPFGSGGVGWAGLFYDMSINGLFLELGAAYYEKYSKV